MYNCLTCHCSSASTLLASRTSSFCDPVWFLMSLGCWLFLLADFRTLVGKHRKCNCSSSSLSEDLGSFRTTSVPEMLLLYLSLRHCTWWDVAITPYSDSSNIFEYPTTCTIPPSATNPGYGSGLIIFSHPLVLSSSSKSLSFRLEWKVEKNFFLLCSFWQHFRLLFS